MAKSIERIANKVKDYREKKAWSIAELAREARISPNTVSKMERGLFTQKTKRIKITQALEVEYARVFPNNND